MFKLDSNQLTLPNYYFRKTITPSQIGALNSSPLTFFPAVPNFLTVPTWTFASRLVGDNWTFAGVLSIKYSGSSITLFTSVDATILTQTPPKEVLCPFPFNVFPNDSYYNLDLILSASVGNPTNGTSSLDITMFYNLWPRGFAFS